MSTKRGLLILVVLLLTLSFAGAEEVVDTELDSATQIFNIAYLKDEGSSHTNNQVRFKDTPREDEFCEKGGGNDREWPTPSPATDCGGQDCCSIQLVKFDNNARDECSGKYLPSGQILYGWITQSVSYVGSDWFSYGDRYAPSTLLASADSASYVCDDQAWRLCSAAGVGSVLSVEILDEEGEMGRELFYCLETEDNKYAWTNEPFEGTDRDGDDVPDLFDCAPDNFGVHPDFWCKDVVSEDSGGNPYECSLDGTCSNGDFCGDDGRCYSTQCDVEATDICSDGIDNTCENWNGEENYDYTSFDTECDDNEYSCLHYCTSQTGKCSWIDANNFNNCCGDDRLSKIRGNPAKHLNKIPIAK
jgi:hypothetical protein